MFLLLFAYYFYHGGCLWKSSKESLKPLKKRTKRLLICATASAFGHLRCLPGKLAIAIRQRNTYNRLQTSLVCQFITYWPAKRLLPASSPLQKRTNFSNCTGHCHRTNNLSLSGNSRDFWKPIQSLRNTSTKKKDYQFRMVPTLRPVLRRCAYE